MMLSIRWSKVSILAVAMTAILSVAFIAPIVISRIREYRAAQVYPHPASDAEQSEILRVLLKANDYYTFPPPPPPLEASAKSSEADPIVLKAPPTVFVAHSIVLIDSSFAFCGQQVAKSIDKLGCIYPPETEQAITSDDDNAEIPRKLRLELIAANRVLSVIPDPHDSSILYRSRVTIEKLEGSGQFGTIYPHASGVIEVSRAALSEDGVRATIYVEFRRRTFGTGVLYYLARAGSTWRISSSNVLWIT